MRWIVFAMVVALAACGGPQIPQHNGYKGAEKAKPWKKPKELKFSDKGEAKTEGELSYADYRRAKWFSIDLASHGELALRLEITPPGDATNDDFDLAMEVLDPGYRVIAKSDLEDEDAHELTKTKTLIDLTPGKYLVHVYLQGRMDTADFILRATFKATRAAEVKTDFPAQVEFPPMLAQVPIQDDAPAKYKPQPPIITGPRTPRKPPTLPDPKKPVAKVLAARIVGVSIVSGGVQILIGRGTATDASNGMHAQLKGISGSFEVNGCTETTCRALVTATADQVKAAGGSVTLVP
jgi:hypothetical protein